MKKNISIKALSSDALLIEFEQRIAPEILWQVLALERLIQQHLPKGIRETLPAYASLAVFYEPSFWAFAKLKSAVLDLLPLLSKTASHLPSGRRQVKGKKQMKVKSWEVPVCYGGSLGPDLRQMAEERGVSEERLVEWHSDRPYPVYMLGFMPGFVYLGEPDERLHQPRRSKPRARVAAGSVAIGGRQTGIYALAGPAGWNIIGRTPVELFQLREERPSPFRPGDVLRFVPIDKREFETQQALWQAGRHPLQKQWYD